MKRVICILGALWLAGCYTYVPASITSVQPGQQVKAYVTTDEGQRIAGEASAPVSLVAGFVDATTPKALNLNVQYFGTVDGGHVVADEQPLTLSPAAVTRMETRRFSTSRTILFVAALAVAPVLVGAIVNGVAITNPAGSGNNGTQNTH
jgi:hypothetical protein